VPFLILVVWMDACVTLVVVLEGAVSVNSVRERTGPSEVSSKEPFCCSNRFERQMSHWPKASSCGLSSRPAAVVRPQPRPPFRTRAKHEQGTGIREF